MAARGASSSVHEVSPWPASICFDWVTKPVIRTSTAQVPATALGNRYAPASSVVVTNFPAGPTAVTTAPGAGSPPARTTPRWTAGVWDSATETNKRRKTADRGMGPFAR